MNGISNAQVQRILAREIAEAVARKPQTSDQEKETEELRKWAGEALLAIDNLDWVHFQTPEFRRGLLDVFTAEVILKLTQGVF